MKLNWKRELFALIVLVTMVGVGIYYYRFLPETMASRFDLHGKPIGWMKKEIFYLVMIGTNIFIYLLFTFLPFIDPLKKRIEAKFNNILFLRNVFIVFFTVIFSLSLQGAHEGALNINIFGIVFGLLFIVIGNYMPKIPQNWFVGIRTPWTISSEIVWKKTHIFGGWLFVLSGALYLICTVLNINSTISLLIIIFIPLISVPCSFFLYKKMEKQIT